MPWSDNPVIKTCTHGDQQVTLLHREVRRFGAMHSQHAQVVRIICFNCAQPFQRAHVEQALGSLATSGPEQHFLVLKHETDFSACLDTDPCWSIQ